jgi:hypothetical protein
MAVRASSRSPAACEAVAGSRADDAVTIDVGDDDTREANGRTAAAHSARSPKMRSPKTRTLTVP